MRSFSGLDPVAARDVHELIDELRGRGITIFLTTHRVEEAERLCDRVAILNTTFRTIGRPDELRDQLFAKTLAVRTLAPLAEPDRVFAGLGAVDTDPSGAQKEFGGFAPRSPASPTTSCSGRSGPARSCRRRSAAWSRSPRRGGARVGRTGDRLVTDHDQARPLRRAQPRPGGHHDPQHRREGHRHPGIPSHMLRITVSSSAGNTPP